MAESKQSEGLLLLQNENIDEFNKWRMRNLTLKLAFDKIDFSKKNISNAFLNGASFIDCNFSNSTLRDTNFVQSNLMNSIFDAADLSNAIMMFADLKNSLITNSNLNNTNFMGSNLQKADLRGSILNRTIFVEANLIDANTFGLDKSKAFFKSSKLKGTTWE